MSTFAELGISSEILSALSDLGFEEPTPIQAQAIPLILKEHADIVSLAQTGTGKTAAFGLPLIQLTDPKSRATQGLVLCPTRELCMQVARDLETFAKNIDGVRILAVYGGASIEQQVRELRKGAQIIVATPGRLRDMIQRGMADVSAVRYAVFDEADEMLNMGFQEELNAILAETPKEKNTLLFSATMSKEVAEIANRYMSNPVEVTVGSRNAGAENVTHEYYVVRFRDRYAALKRILDNAPDIYSIIFCRTRMDTQEIADKLLQDGYKADALHGDLTQAQRDLVMRKFHSRHLQILVATDVAARGLDVSDLTHVINYSLPDDIASYTHRSGRTGRAGRTGTSVALVDTREVYKIRQIEHRLRKDFTRCLIPNGEEICRKQLGSLINRISNTEVRYEQIDPLYAELAHQLAQLDKEELVKKIISLEFNRFLEYYKNAPDLNPSMNASKGRDRERIGGRKPLNRDFTGRESTSGKERNFARFHLNVGRRDGLLPEYVVGRINEVPGGGRIKVGKIEIMRNTATIEGDSRFISQILDTFQQAQVNGKPVNIRLIQDKDSDHRPSRKNDRERPESRKKFRRLREQHR